MRHGAGEAWIGNRIVWTAHGLDGGAMMEEAAPSDEGKQRGFEEGRTRYGQKEESAAVPEKPDI